MKNVYLIILSLVLILTACASEATETQPTGPQTITVMTHDSFSVREEVVRSF